MNIKPMRRRDASKLLSQIESEYGYKPEDFLDKYVFFVSDKNKIYLINNDIKDINLEKVRINSLGLYLCEINNNQIRLSIEGSQMIGPKATKNILEVDDLTARSWLKGEDLECDPSLNSFVIIKNNNDFLGCGKCKEGKVFSYMPKIRRIRAAD